MHTWVFTNVGVYAHNNINAWKCPTSENNQWSCPAMTSKKKKKKQWPAWYSNPKDEGVLHICLTNNPLIGIKNQLNKS